MSGQEPNGLAECLLLPSLWNACDQSNITRHLRYGLPRRSILKFLHAWADLRQRKLP
jgi:hypothetical protein